jgi:hypothetical protein
MPISGELGIISNLGGLFVPTGSRLRDSEKRPSRDDICHHPWMMIGTGAFPVGSAMMSSRAGQI